MRRRKKRSIMDELFGGSLFNEEELLPNGLSETGYSISVSQTPKGTVVKAKVGKDTDVNSFRKRLQQKYPGAEIEIEGGSAKPLIREISTRPLREEREDNETES